MTEAETTTSIDSDERRANERVSVELWVEESTDRELYFQRGANLSVGGIFLERTVPHPLGSVVNLRFSLPGGGDSIEVKGEIVNVGDAADDLGMGVKFLDLGDAERDRIDRFIERANVRAEQTVRADDRAAD